MSKLDTLDPSFRVLVEQLVQSAEGATDRQWVVTSCRRTMKEQKALYAQGRSRPGQVVTNAKPGSSPHNYGLAADLAPLKIGSSEIDWNADRAIWEKMAAIAVEIGLVAGANFKTILDFPHVESPKWREQRALYNAGKIQVA